MNIVLIGMRGSGKTTIGKLLAKKLNWDLLETDLLVENTAKMSIREIVEKFGWQKFRDFETDAIEKISGSDNVVVATGGGVVTNINNILRLKNKGILIWLRANIDTLANRIGADPKRPLLTNEKNMRDDLKTTFSQRVSLYQKAADHIVETVGKSPNQIVKEITSFLKGKNYL